MNFYKTFGLRCKNIIFNLPRPIKQGGIIILDATCSYASVWLSFALLLGSYEPLVGSRQAIFWLSCFIFLPIFLGFGLYRAIFRFSGWAILLTMSRAIFFYSSGFFLIVAVYGVSDTPRAIGFLQPLLFFNLIGIARAAIRFFLDRPMNFVKTNKTSQVLIYGIGTEARHLASVLKKNQNFSLCGYLEPENNFDGATIDGIKVYSLTQLNQIFRSFPVTDILLADSEIENQAKKLIIDEAQKYSVRVRQIPSVLEIISGCSLMDFNELDENDLLGRSVVLPQKELLEQTIKDRIVLVTGAGGSIGGELCRQILALSPSHIILLDNSEASLYHIYEEIKRQILKTKSSTELLPIIGSVTDKEFLRILFSTWRPHTVYHAAAYKHVPLVEHNVCMGVLNNVIGTLNCSLFAEEFRVKNFVLISTDKAVRPTNVMGASKRLAEMVVQGMANENLFNKPKFHKTIFSIVRFGNVIGSSGSVVPLFKSQIENGGPVTVTHSDITRYFMSIPEAAQLVIQAAGLSKGGELYILDMGNPVAIYDLAQKMIRLSGRSIRDVDNPNGDIEIKFIGLRPGEKLYEELLISADPQKTSHPKIMMANEKHVSYDVLIDQLNDMKKEINRNNAVAVLRLISGLIPEYKPQNMVDIGSGAFIAAPDFDID